MSGPERKVCAIYTRKSTEEGLDQSFNSLDAQREACEAYVKSQSHEGWVLLNEPFDDGGISGGTMERPGLLRLMDKVEAGSVDIIVVYKVDRLTRSLADFARIVDVLDKRGASFVSVTQQFNTTSSMGRLTLNVLLSFAQFEREVTAERIRDKFRASKEKGMWMGGHPPLGYDIADRRLIVNEAEAETVRMIYRRYAEVKSAVVLLEDLKEAGIRSKKRTTQSGKLYGGNVFTRGALYCLLSNKTYLGKVDYKGTVHEGEHEAIVPVELWEQVQKTMSANKAERTKTNTPSRSFLKGLLCADDGRVFTPSHARKQGKRYRYYQTCKDGAGQVTRLPAPQIEEHVVTHLRQFFQDPKRVIIKLEAMGLKLDANRVLIETTRLAALLASPFEADAQTLSKRLLTKVVVGEDQVDLHLCPRALSSELSNRAIPEEAILDPITLSGRFELKRSSQGVRMVTPPIGKGKPDDSDTTLQALRQAHQWLDLLTSGKARTYAEIARKEGTDTRFVARTVRLAFLAPNIVRQALDPNDPFTLEVEKVRRGPDLPLCWEEQVEALNY